MIRSKILLATLGVLGLAMFSGCAIEASSDEEPIPSASEPTTPASPWSVRAQDDGHSYGYRSEAAKATGIHVPHNSPSSTSSPPSLPCDKCGPYPEPWSTTPD